MLFTGFDFSENFSGRAELKALIQHLAQSYNGFYGLFESLRAGCRSYWLA